MNFFVYVLGSYVRKSNVYQGTKFNSHYKHSQTLCIINRTHRYVTIEGFHEGNQNF